MFHPARFVCRNRRLALLAGSLFVTSQAAAGTVCIVCNPPNSSIRCEIRKSEAVEGLPFSEELLNKACAKLIKLSYGAHGCHTSKETTCRDSSVKSFSLKEAKRALLGEAPALPTSEPLNRAPQLPPAASAQTSPNVFTAAWHKFIALLTWH